MKTIQFTGTVEQVDDLTQNLSDNHLDLTTETRVYVVDMNDNNFDGDNTTDEEFMTLAEENGRVYTLDGFQEAFNFEEINSSIDVIRFISVSI